MVEVEFNKSIEQVFLLLCLVQKTLGSYLKPDVLHVNNNLHNICIRRNSHSKKQMY
jgi:hypothetical protein